jgi:hypothetical protein
MFLSAGVDWAGSPIAGDKGSTSMSLAQDEVLLVERDDPARVSLSFMDFHIFLKKSTQENTTHGTGLGK